MGSPGIPIASGAVVWEALWPLPLCGGSSKGCSEKC